MNNRLAGLFPPIPTPFDREGALAIDRFRENLERWAEFQLQGLLVLGSNGESPFLSDQEKLQLVGEARKKIAQGRAMIVGAGRESTRLCSEFVNKVADLGADFVLLGMPCYYKPQMSEHVLFAHFWEIADESPVPVLIYNIPQFTGITASAALFERLAAHENIAGMKDSSGNLTFQAEVRRRTPDRFKILVGSAPTLLPSLIQGACGGVGAISCAIPQLTIDLYQSFVSGDWRGAASLQQRLTPAAVAVTATYGIAGLKAAMDLVGFYGGPPRRPLLPLDENQRAAIASLLRDAGAI